MTQAAGRVVVVGDVVTDVVAVLAGEPAPGSDTAARIQLTGGGQAANTAAWLARQGTAVTLVAVIGTDEAGRSRRAELAGAAVTSALRQDPHAPTGTVIVLTDGADRTMITDRGANLRLRPDDVDRALAGAPDAVHLHLSGYPLLDGGSRAAGRHALRAARARGLTTSVDAASAGPLRRCGAAAFLTWVRDTDLLLANQDEAQALTGLAEPAAMCRALALEVRAVVVKLGAGGALWAGHGAGPAGSILAVPAEPATVVDPTGAGDAFAAGLLAAWTAGAGPAAALRAGAALGARAVGTTGARPSGHA